MIINDPVFGFIEVEDGLLTTLVKHPFLIRLTRLKQLGATHYVYPGAMHTRFQHSIGALHLANAAIESLENKGVCILEKEREGTLAAMLLHDIGHGPFSHALEHSFVTGISHEEISLLMMEQLNRELNGQLDTAISIFKDTYPRHFLHELICSQLDMDRLDYLCRDSFFAGIREGTIGVARIIKMLDVKDDRLVVERKGIYTIENYLMARRLMYWQVYLHKTVMAAQELLVLAMQRARELLQSGQDVGGSHHLRYFLSREIGREEANAKAEWLSHFAELDDNDVEQALKEWSHHPDKTLSLLASDYIHRHLFKAEELPEPIAQEDLEEKRREMAEILSVSHEEAAYFVRYCESGQMLYSSEDEHISIHFKDGSIHDISEFSELLKSNLTNKKSRRYYLFSRRNEGQNPAPK